MDSNIDLLSAAGMERPNNQESDSAEGEHDVQGFGSSSNGSVGSGGGSSGAIVDREFHASVLPHPGRGPGVEVMILRALQ